MARSALPRASSKGTRRVRAQLVRSWFQIAIGLRADRLATTLHPRPFSSPCPLGAGRREYGLALAGSFYPSTSAQGRVHTEWRLKVRARGPWSLPVDDELAQREAWSPYRIARRIADGDQCVRIQRRLQAQ